MSAKGDGVVSLTAWSDPSDSAKAVPLTVVDATLTKVGTDQVRVTWAYGAGCTGFTAARHFVNHVKEYADGSAVSGEYQSTPAPPYTLPADLAHLTSGSPLVRARWIRLQLKLDEADGPTERSDLRLGSRAHASVQPPAGVRARTSTTSRSRRMRQWARRWAA